MEINKGYTTSLIALRTPIFITFILTYVATYFFEFNNFIAILFQIILIVILIGLEYKRTKKVSSPLIFWYLLWCIVIIVARIDLGIYDLGSTWDVKLLSFVVVNTCTFYFSFIIVSHISTQIKKIASSKKAGVLKNKRLNKQKLYLAVNLILIISNTAFVLNAILLGNIPQLSSAVNVNRIGFVTTPLFSVVNVTRIVFSFVPILLKMELRKKQEMHLKAQTIISILFNFLTGWRGYVFQILVILLTSQLLLTDWEKKKERKKEKRIIIKTLILVFLLIGIVAVTRANSVSQTLEGNRYFEYTLEQIYLYITPNFLNFQQALNTIIPNNDFLYTSEFLWGLIIDNNRMPGYVPLSFSTGSFNVSTYLLHPYADFGLLGTMIWSSLFGGVSAYFFEKARVNKNIINMAVVGVCNVIIFTMHNGFFLRSSSVVIWFLIAIFINKKSYETKVIPIKEHLKNTYNIEWRE